MKYFKKLVGKRIYLSPINPDDYEINTKWINDKEVTENLGLHASLISLSNEKTALESMTCDSNRYNFAIVLNDNDTYIGNISFNTIDNLNQNGSIGLFIGEEEYRSNGYGTEAIKLLLEYGFKTLNLNNIMLTVNSTNKRGISCYKKCGFKEFGKRTKSSYVNGEFIDIIYMEILKEEF